MSKRFPFLVLMLVIFLIANPVICAESSSALPGKIAPAPQKSQEVKEIEKTLDGFHEAAARADEERYFGCFAPEGVFMGTDATERWTASEFRAWALPYFQRETAWTFHPVKRFVFLADERDVAWFDEVLDSEHYGELRGTGVLKKIGDKWKIAHYNLSMPVPNEKMAGVLKHIRDEETAEKPSPETNIILVRHAEKKEDPSNPNPALSDAGKKRAEKLAWMLRHVKLSAAYATQYKRTQDTVAPATAQNGIEITIADAQKVMDLTQKLNTSHAGKWILVSGHSNTVPALIQALGVESKIEIKDDEYGNLFIVTIRGNETPRLLHLHY